MIDFIALILFSVQIYGLLNDTNIQELVKGEEKAKYRKMLQVII